MISIIFEVRRWSDIETKQNRVNRDEPLAISYAFEKKSKDLARMLPSKPGGMNRSEIKGLAHSDLFMKKAVEQTKKARLQITPKKIERPAYIGPERRKANLPRLKKVA